MNINELTEQTLAATFDHTCLYAYATREHFEKLCAEAASIQAAMVAINSAQVKLCKQLLAGTNVHVGAAISFPLGQTPLEIKVRECETAIRDGADEIDYVINVGEAKMGHWDYIEEEMRQMKAVCHAHNVLCKVIFENCYLETEEIKKLSEIARDVKPDYIKTSTGFGTGGATLEDVRLMKETVGDAVKVKAAGGIRDWPTCKAMLEAGAERIGTRSAMQILEGFRAERGIK